MNDLLTLLPEYDPHPDLWARIEADLDSDAVVARVVSELPQHEPTAALWERIADELDDVPVLPIGTKAPVAVSPFTVVRPLWTGLAAAALLVLVGTWLVMRPEADETIRIEYAVEQPTNMPTDTREFSAADERAEAFIDRQCAEQQLACQRPEVHELRNQLADLSVAQKRIEQERLTFGDDPTLVRAQVKIENQRAEVTKELITLLRS